MKYFIAILFFSIASQSGAQPELPDTAKYDKLAKAFESKLTAKDIAMITQDNPYAVARLTGGFTLIPLYRRVGHCGDREFESLKKKVGAASLKKEGKLAMLYLHVMDTVAQDKYLERVQQLVRTSKMSAADKEMLSIYYKMVAMAYRGEYGRSQAAEQKTKYTAQFQQVTGIPEKDLLHFAYTFASNSPPCLAGLDVKVAKRLDAMK